MGVDYRWRPAIAAGLLALATTAAADDAVPAGEPRWEWGLGLGAAWLRDYPGSGHYGAYALPYPWITWRSERVRLGREGGRGVLWRTPAFTLDAVLSANPPSDTGDNPERAGMDDLDALVEPGLRLRWRTWTSGSGWRIDTRLTLRQSYAVDGGLQSLGGRVEPGFSAEHALRGRWSWGGSITASFGERGWQDYFYGVDPEFATPDRPAYEAPGGFGGMQYNLRLSRRGDATAGSLFVRLEDLTGASFIDSPLVSERHGWSVGINLTRRMGASRQQVKPEEY